VSATGALAAMTHPKQSGPLPVDDGSAPIAVKAPHLTRANDAGRFSPSNGPFRVGQRLGTTTGTWRGSADLKLTISWQRCTAQGECADIDGANATLYGNGAGGAIPAADRGSSLLARITATNADGRETTLSTRSTGPILPAKR